MSPTATRRPARRWGDHYRGLGRCHCGQPRSRSPPPGPRLALKNVLTWVGLHVFAFFPIFSPRHVPTQQDVERPPSQRSRDWVDVAAPPDSRGGHRSPVPERLLSAPRFHSDARCVCGLPTSDSLEHTHVDSLGWGAGRQTGRRGRQAPTPPTPCLSRSLPPPPRSWKGPGGFGDSNACLSCTFPSRRRDSSGWEASTDDGSFGLAAPSFIMLDFFNTPGFVDPEREFRASVMGTEFRQ